jgi:hypothetical protein
MPALITESRGRFTVSRPMHSNDPDWDEKNLGEDCGNSGYVVGRFGSAALLSSIEIAAPSTRYSKKCDQSPARVHGDGTQPKRPAMACSAADHRAQPLRKASRALAFPRRQPSPFRLRALVFGSLTLRVWHPTFRPAVSQPVGQVCSCDPLQFRRTQCRL